MKYYSDELKQFFPTEAECKAAEDKFFAKRKEEDARKAKLSEERKARAKEVEEAYKRLKDARKAYSEKLSQFVEDFGSFHMTISEPNETSVFDIFEKFFKF